MVAEEGFKGCILLMTSDQKKNITVRLRELPDLDMGHKTWHQQCSDPMDHCKGAVTKQQSCKTFFFQI